MLGEEVYSKTWGVHDDLVAVFGYRQSLELIVASSRWPEAEMGDTGKRKLAAGQFVLLANCSTTDPMRRGVVKHAALSFYSAQNDTQDPDAGGLI